MTYLLKVTVAWTLFLLLFELFYKNNGRYTVNRLYLLFSIAAGLLLPLIQLPSGVQTVVANTQAFYPAILNAAPQTTAAITTVTAPATAAKSNFDLWLILRILYGMGIALLALKFLLEFVYITRLALRYPGKTIAGHKVIVTGKKHAPYSFMGRIFIGDPGVYQPEELQYIVSHEAAHNDKKHWLDLLLLQLGCIVLWFHPLVWRYRYLLKMQHEYEADDLASRDDAYTYGHFLLQQTLLNGVPSIAHSFHFSPIKNRIKMITKRQTRKPGNWKYILVIPALLGCTFLMAKSVGTKNRMQQGYTITYNGNTFSWRQTDTLFYDKQKKRVVTVPKEVGGSRKIIYSMNDEPVYENANLGKPATYGRDEMAYADYVRQEFAKRCRNTADSASGVILSNVVISKEGKIVYYDAQYVRPYLRTRTTYKELNPFPEKDYILNSIVEKIITDSPAWKPAMVDGKPVNSVINFGGC